MRNAPSDGFRVMTRIVVFAGSMVVLALLLHVVTDVTLRYAFRSPIKDTVERVTYWWMPVMAFLGMVVAQEGKEHIDVPLVYMRARPRSRLLLDIFRNVLMTGFLIVIGYFGLLSAVESMRAGEYRSGVTIWPARYLVPIAALIFVAYLIRETVQIIRNGTGAEEALQLPTET